MEELGLRNLNQMNAALMMKLGWRLMEEKGSLWTKVLQGKYSCNADSYKSIKAKQGASNAWKGISKVAAELEKGSKVVARNGRSTLFWMDRWLIEEPLQKVLIKDITREEGMKKVHDYWIKGEGWNWQALEGILPFEIENKLAAYSLMDDDNVEDSSCWRGTNNGHFTVKSAYDMINKSVNQGKEHTWKDIWKLQVPNRMRVFLWLVRHKKIMSNDVRVKRGFTTDGRCTTCLHEIEDVDHIFRKCIEARGIWRELISPRKYQADLNLNFDDWLMGNLSKYIHKEGKPDWKNMFAIAIWWIWKWRNEYVFKEKKMDIRTKVRWIKEQYWEIRTAFSTRRVLSNNLNVYRDRYIKWTPPPKDWCALNVDGCVKFQYQRAGGGGILRNEYGDWIVGFIHNIGNCTSEEAELWAVYKGLEIAWELGHKKLVLQCDSKMVVNWIQNAVTPCSSSINLVSRCKNLLAKDWEVKVRHIYREENRAADFLASTSLEHARGWSIIEEPPTRLKEIMEEDRLGPSICRRVIIK